MSWWWRTKPRSILRTIQWFPFFGQLENKNWDEEDFKHKSKKNGKTIHPIRREYIYNAHGEEDDSIGKKTFKEYLSGKSDEEETESNGRNDKTTFEFFGFGYVDENGIIHVTDVGRRIMDGKFDDEDFLKQLLKLQFPNNIQNLKNHKDNGYIYPLELVCKAIKNFEFLNRSELVLLFGCVNREKMDETFNAIAQFRNGYQKIKNRNNSKEVKNLCLNIFKTTYKCSKINIDTYYDYAEALSRCLIYTGLFKASGRSIATKIRVPEYSMSKLDMIIEKITFENKTFNTIDEYMQWYGDPNAIILPWDNIDERRKIIMEKIQSVKNISHEIFAIHNNEKINKEIADFIKIAEKISQGNSISKLKDIEKQLVNFITNIKEKEFISTSSKTKEVRDEILSKYDEIIHTIDMGALWLEVNTWKSLIAINGEKTVKRNFNVEEDLTPKSFAPGIGNTPDMEMYTNKYVIIPEVSLMTGVQQWEHEASSVIDHVLSFIKEIKDKKVIGLFISTSINIRTKWQFFILNRESWVEMPVPVIPLTIKQYKEIIEVFYKKNLDIDEFTYVIDFIGHIAIKSKNYTEWFDKTQNFIKNWIDKQTA